jgi:hypothetical protein
MLPTPPRTLRSHRRASPDHLAASNPVRRRPAREEVPVKSLALKPSLIAALAAVSLVACNKNEPTGNGSDGDRRTTTSTSRAAVDEIRELHRGELSAVTTYDEVLKRMGKAEWKPTLERIREQHRSAADSLRARVTALGGTADSSAGAWGAWADLVAKSGAALSDESGIEALKTGQKHGVDEYEDALEDDDVDADTKALIRNTLLPQAKRQVDELNALK